MFSINQQIGYSGEQLAAKKLKSQGFDVQFLSKFTNDFDLIIYADHPVLVEVKYSNMRRKFKGVRNNKKRYSDCWMFDTARFNHNIDHIYLLICNDGKQDFFYVVPSWLVSTRQQITITSHPLQYRGMFAKYLNRFDAIFTVTNRLNQSEQLRLC